MEFSQGSFLTASAIKPHFPRIVIMIMAASSLIHYLEFRTHFSKYNSTMDNQVRRQTQQVEGQYTEPAASLFSVEDQRITENEQIGIIEKAPPKQEAKEGTFGIMGEAPPKEEEAKEASPVHVLFGLSGNHDGFFAEFEVALRSVMLNAPHHSPLEIHIMADEEAHMKLNQDTLPRVFLQESQTLSDNATQEVTTANVSMIIDGNTTSTATQTTTRTITTTSHNWHTNVTIITYNCQSYMPQWKETISLTTGKDLATYHTIGTYFRHFAHDVLPAHVHTVFYIDTDVVILANLAQLFDEAPPDEEEWYFKWSLDCAGVMLIHVRHLPLFWERCRQVKPTGIFKRKGNNDQDMVIIIRDIFDPNNTQLVQPLSQAWDLHVTGHWRGNKKREQLLRHRPEVGLVHYNGGGSNKGSYWDTSPHVKDEFAKDGWGIPARFYSVLPWSWAFFMGQSFYPGSESANNRIRISDCNVTRVIVNSNSSS